MLCFKRAFITLVALLLVPSLLHSQAAEGPLRVPSTAAHTYQNSAEDLRQQLEDVLAAARAGDRAKLMFLVRQMEVPNYEGWFTKAFGKEKGEIWAQPYGHNFDKNESDFQNSLMQFAKEDGEIVTRKVNDAPEPENDIESDMLALLQRPVDIYSANWQRRGAPQGSKGDFIGYFVFVDGRFRWDSTIMYLKIPPVRTGSSAESQTILQSQSSGQPSNSSKGASGGPPLLPGGVISYPSCVFCPDPEYTKRARAQHLEGVVVLKVTIESDGLPSDIQLVKSPNPDLADLAIAAVRKWRFSPAIGPSGEPVAAITPIEVNFRLLK